MGRLSFWVVLLGLGLGAAAGAEPGPRGADGDRGEPPAATVVDLAAVSDLEGILPRLADARVVYVSELHNRYDHHLNQLAIIRGLHARDPDLVIAMEFFQQPFQSHLDDYVAGRIDEREMLRRTEYYDRWRFDYRLYRPILRYAREHGIPLVALGLAAETTARLRRVGLSGLDPEERTALPEHIDYGDAAYAERLRQVYAHHPPNESGGGFDRFMEIQLVWDEVMAERAADYLRAHPGTRMVVLAGGGHVTYGSGIPRRVDRRLAVDQAIVVNGAGHRAPDPKMGDYLLYTEARDLPPAGRLGVVLDGGEKGVVITGFADNSAGQEAGLEEGDVIAALGEGPVASFADVQLALWDKRPGDVVEVRVRRERWLGGVADRSYRVELR
jgi:uncharacterized iron-regulated protein